MRSADAAVTAQRQGRWRLAYVTNDIVSSLKVTYVLPVACTQWYVTKKPGHCLYTALFEDFWT